MWRPLVDAKTLDATKEKPASILPRTHFAAARLFESQGLSGKAINQYRKTVAVDHSNVPAYHRLGLLLGQVGQHRAALDPLRRAVELRPDNAILRNNYGFELLLNRRWAEAEAQFTRTIQLQPDFPRAYINRGIALSRLGRFADALVSFEKILPASDAQYNLGLMYRAQQRYDEAAQAFRCVLDRDANFTAAVTQLEQIAPHLTVETPPVTELRLIDARPPTRAQIVVVAPTAVAPKATAPPTETVIEQRPTATTPTPVEKVVVDKPLPVKKVAASVPPAVPTKKVVAEESTDDVIAPFDTFLHETGSAPTKIARKEQNQTATEYPDPTIVEPKTRPMDIATVLSIVDNEFECLEEEKAARRTLAATVVDQIGPLYCQADDPQHTTVAVGKGAAPGLRSQGPKPPTQRGNTKTQNVLSEKTKPSPKVAKTAYKKKLGAKIAPAELANVRTGIARRGGVKHPRAKRTVFAIKRSATRTARIVDSCADIDTLLAVVRPAALGISLADQPVKPVLGSEDFTYYPVTAMTSTTPAPAVLSSVNSVALLGELETQLSLVHNEIDCLTWVDAPPEAVVAFAPPTPTVPADVALFLPTSNFIRLRVLSAPAAESMVGPPIELSIARPAIRAAAPAPRKTKAARLVVDVSERETQTDDNVDHRRRHNRVIGSPRTTPRNESRSLDAAAKKKPATKGQPSGRKHNWQARFERLDDLLAVTRNEITCLESRENSTMGSNNRASAKPAPVKLDGGKFDGLRGAHGYHRSSLLN